jgi:hypothetical protein
VKVQKDILNWLLHTPCGDINWKGAVEEANPKTLYEATKYEISKLARQKINSRLKDLVIYMYTCPICGCIFESREDAINCCECRQ